MDEEQFSLACLPTLHLNSDPVQSILSNRNGFAPPLLHPHYRPDSIATSHVSRSWKVDCIANSNRADTVLLARLRAGRTPLLNTYAHLLDSTADPTCPLCRESPQTLEHWLQRCPNLEVLRQHTFASHSPLPRVFTADPKKVLVLSGATSYSPRRPPQQQRQSS